MTLQEYEAQGGCEGCYFYRTIDVDGRKGCTFDWFDNESEDWECGKMEDYVYKRITKGSKIMYYCSYHCMREALLEDEAKKRAKKLSRHKTSAIV